MELVPGLPPAVRFLLGQVMLDRLEALHEWERRESPATTWAQVYRLPAQAPAAAAPRRTHPPA